MPRPSLPYHPAAPVIPATCTSPRNQQVAPRLIGSKALQHLRRSPWSFTLTLAVLPLTGTAQAMLASWGFALALHSSLNDLPPDTHSTCSFPSLSLLNCPFCVTPSLTTPSKTGMASTALPVLLPCCVSVHGTHAFSFVIRLAPCLPRSYHHHHH